MKESILDYSSPRAPGEPEGPSPRSSPLTVFPAVASSPARGMGAGLLVRARKAARGGGCSRARGEKPRPPAVSCAPPPAHGCVMGPSIWGERVRGGEGALAREGVGPTRIVCTVQHVQRASSPLTPAAGAPARRPSPCLQPAGFVPGGLSPHPPQCRWRAVGREGERVAATRAQPAARAQAAFLSASILPGGTGRAKMVADVETEKEAAFWSYPQRPDVAWVRSASSPAVTLPACVTLGGEDSSVWGAHLQGFPAQPHPQCPSKIPSWLLLQRNHIALAS